MLSLWIFVVEDYRLYKLTLDGCVKQGTGRCGDTWGRPMSSSGRQSADMMMMKLTLLPIGDEQQK